MHSNATNKLTVSQLIFIGAAAGFFEVTINHPLWVIKARMQYGDARPLRLTGIYSGLSTNVVSMVPVVALRIVLSNLFKQSFFDKYENNSVARVMPGVMGGVVTSVIVSPLEMFRGLQVVTGSSFTNTVKQCVKRQGWPVLFVGMPGTAIRDAFYTLGFFALAPSLRIKIQKYFDQELVKLVVAGGIAGTIAAFSSQPFDSIKMRQQLKEPNSNLLITAYKIYKERGLGGFFYGATPRVLRVISGVTIISTVSQKAIECIEKNKINEVRPKI